MPATYEPIATTTVGSATATVTFSSVSSSYTDIVIIFNGAITTGLEAFGIRANNDSGANYSRVVLAGNGSTASSFTETNATNSGMGIIHTDNSSTIIHIQNYSNATTYKTFLSRGNAPSSTSRISVGLWRNTSAINRLDFVANSSTFIAGSTFTLYGIKAA